MRCLRWLPVVVLLALPAHAAGLSIEAAGGYWFAGAPQFQVTLRVDQPLGEHVQVGLRSGLLLNVPGSVQIGVPIDVGFRFRIGRMFLEPVGGPWFVFGDPWFLRAHIGLAVGALFHDFSLALEGGWLQPSALLVLRFGFRF